MSFMPPYIFKIVRIFSWPIHSRVQISSKNCMKIQLEPVVGNIDSRCQACLIRQKKLTLTIDTDILFAVKWFDNT